MDVGIAHVKPKYGMKLNTCKNFIAYRPPTGAMKVCIRWIPKADQSVERPPAVRRRCNRACIGRRISGRCESTRLIILKPAEKYGIDCCLGSSSTPSAKPSIGKGRPCQTWSDSLVKRPKLPGTALPRSAPGEEYRVELDAGYFASALALEGIPIHISLVAAGNIDVRGRGYSDTRTA